MDPARTRPWSTLGALLLSTVLAFGCGSRGTDQSGMASQPAVSPPQTAPVATAAPPGATPAPAQTNAQAVLQAVLETPELQQYFHADKPGRAPLVMVLPSVTFLDPPPALVKFGAPVRWVTRAEAEQGNGAYLEITAIELRDASATVQLRYRIEGVHGKVTLDKTAGGWAVKSADIAES
jgi:hypothetical protein